MLIRCALSNYAGRDNYFYVSYVYKPLGWPHFANANTANVIDSVCVYTCDQLITLRHAVSEHGMVLSDIPAGPQRGEKKRECPGGAKVCEKSAAKNKKHLAVSVT